MLTEPYVMPVEFKAHPTFLDLGNLRSGSSSQAEQDAELYNILLRASSWADNFVSAGGFKAHTVVEQCRTSVDGDGRLRLTPSDIPALSVQQVAYGASPTLITTLTNPTVWIEDGRQVIVELAGASSWSGSLQFGPPVGRMAFVQWAYTAGYATTTLAATATASAASITVTDPTGLVGPSGILPGTTLRIWNPGKEEAVTVASTYTPGSTTVPLTAALKNTHTYTAGPGSAIGVSALPADAHLAVINAAVCLLARPDSLAEDSYPDTGMTTSTRDADPRHEGMGLLLEAKRILRSYRRTR